MTIGNYINGFEGGVIIRNLLKEDTASGSAFYVGNHPTLKVGEKGASDNNRGTYLQPFSTIDAAYNVATNGDRIYVRPGHTLSIANATTLVMDKSGIQIVGMGVGETRPIITFATATTASIPVSGANNLIANIVFKCNIASQDQMFDLTADDFVVVGCEFREGTATGVSFINADGTDADADRLKIIGCKFYAPTAGNMDNAIALAKDFTNVELIDNYIYGDFNTGGISVPAGGNAQVNLQIRGGEVTNLLTNVGAIVINGTGSSGSISNVLLKTDTLATALDNGSLATDNVRWASIATDQVSSEPVFVGTDSANNILGVDDADNGFASTNVAANRDGSIIERIEYLIQGQADDVANNALGIDDANNVFASTSVVVNRDGSILERLEDIEDAMPRVVASGTAVMVNNNDIFTITGGAIIIDSLVSICITANDGTASTLQYEVDPTVGVAATISAASASLASAAAGATVSLQGTSLATAALLSASGGNLGMATNGIIANAGVISIVIGVGSTTGTWAHYLRYRPLQAGVSVTGI